VGVVFVLEPHDIQQLKKIDYDYDNDYDYDGYVVGTCQSYEVKPQNLPILGI